MPRVWAFSAGWATGVEGLLRPDGSLFRRGKLAMTCLLVERGDELVLIDTGFGRSARLNPWRSPGALFQLMSPVELLPGESAFERVRALGRHPEDVTDIVCTHLDVDHVAGLEDFPWARVHVSREELAAALTSLNPRYHAATWQHAPLLEAYDLQRRDVLGFPWTRDLFGDGSVVLLGTPGHSRGHVAVAVASGNDWIVHVGDSVYLESELIQGLAGLGPGFRLASKLTVDDRPTAERSRRLVANLLQRHDVKLVTSHDTRSLERLAPFPYPIA